MAITGLSLTRQTLYTEDFDMEMKTKWINLIRALIIVIISVVVLIGLTNVLTLKSEDGINQLQALYKQPEDSIDVLFLGSSHVYCDIATGVLWDNYGMASFDLGGAEVPPWVSYYHLKEALKTQKPKVVCYEISVSTIYPTLYQNDEWAVDNCYGMKWNKNRIDSLRLNSEGDDFYKRLIPLNIMHGRYNNLGENDFRNVRDSEKYKGFDPRENIVGEETPDISKVTDVVPCSEKAEENIRSIIRLTRDEGIDIVLFVSPYPVKEEEQKICNYIEQIVISENVPFLNFNRSYDEIGIDFSEDFDGNTHVNYSGNYKYTDYLGRTLKDMYDIPDRRGDSRYVSWEWDKVIQQNQRTDQEIRKCEKAEDILNLTQYGYITFAVIDGKGYIMDNNEIVASGDEGFRLTYESGDDVFLFYGWMDNNNSLYSVFINDEEHIEFAGNILFVYDAIRHEYIRSIYF